ncbi:MAG: ABC transporter ATP-binding protein, partial [Moorella sp. (in: Bacteria)]|nr:ABC transporter ATP-binding protein [Moorella sp. (in: firmicutes)]
ELARWAVERDIPFVPPVARFFARAGSPSIPITVKEGRRLLRSSFKVRTPLPLRPVAGENPGGPLLTMDKIWFTYPNGREALQDISWQVNAGEVVTVLGNNGAGKSTLLKTMAGLLKPGRGRVQLMGRDLSGGGRPAAGRVAYLSQNPNAYLFQDTVEEELLFTLKNCGLPDDGVVDELLEKLALQRCRRVNPRDLSSGERQRVALASVLVTRPRLLVLDEP